MTPVPDQSQAGLRNVLHDQGIPNTLRGVGPIGPAVRSGRPAAAFAIAVGVLVAVLAIVIVRLV